MIESDKERFFQYVDKTEGCWNWTGAKDTGGYGRFSINQKLDGSHRLSYEMAVGSIPEDMCIDHLCRNRGCVNPEHMEVVTRGENVLRGESPCARNARKTHCKNGHPFDEENTYYPPTGGRACRICTRAKYKRNYYRNREAILAQRQEQYRNKKRREKGASA